MTDRRRPADTAHSIAHVGLCVSDLDAAVDWYRDVFEMDLVEGPIDMRLDDPAAGSALSDVFGPEFRSGRVAYMSAGSGAGLELFEFADPPTLPTQAACYWRPGFSHLCFVVPDVEGALRRIEAAGGRIRTRIWQLRPELPYRFVHFEDPFGNLLELHSHPGDQVFGRR